MITQRAQTKVQSLTQLLDTFSPLHSENTRSDNRKNVNKNIEDEEDDILLALAKQEEEFIKLYPVPFESQIHISFELEQEENIQITLRGLTSGETIIIESGKTLPKGNQTYNVNGNHLPNGLYVIKIIEGAKIHTRIIVKK